MKNKFFIASGRPGSFKQVAKIAALLTASTFAVTAMAQTSGTTTSPSGSRAGSSMGNPAAGSSSDSRGSTSSSTTNPAASASGSSTPGSSATGNTATGNTATGSSATGSTSGGMSGGASGSSSGATPSGTSSDSKGSTASSTVNPAVSATRNTSSSGFTMMAPGSSYIGLTAGQSKFRNNYGLGGFSSDSKGKSYGISAGSFFTPFAGLELSYRDFGDTRRAGGTTEAKAGSVSLIGKLPLNEAFSLIGRLGATYSQVDVSAQAGTGIATGRKSGWGPSYGVGAEYSFTPNVSAVVLYDEYRMPYPGGSKEKLNNTSIGVRFKF